MEEKAVKTEQAKKMYTQAEVDEAIGEATRKAIRQERELLCQVIRSIPDLDTITRQGWIENPNPTAAILRQLSVSPSVIVNLDAKPVVPSSWRVIEHIKGGKFKFNPKRVVLYRTEPQVNGDDVSGEWLQHNLRYQSPVRCYNANLLDFYLAHKILIPKSWEIEGNRIYFWGTTYVNDRGETEVRCLHYFQSEWTDDSCPLHVNFGDRPAAIDPGK